jgi:hypothetical protein
MTTTRGKGEFVGSTAAAQPGVLVRVRECYRNPEMRGLIGSIRRRYGGPNYTALEVQFEDRHIALFWPEELDLVKEMPSQSFWRRIFAGSERRKIGYGSSEGR